MEQYGDSLKVSGIGLGKTRANAAINYREMYNQMMAARNGGAKPKMPPIFNNGFAASNGVQKASTDFN